MSNHLDGEEWAGCFTLTSCLMSCDSRWSVAFGAVGWPAACDCGIFWKYIYIFFFFYLFFFFFLPTAGRQLYDPRRHIFASRELSPYLILATFKRCSAVRSQTVSLLLLIQLFVGILCLVLVLVCNTWCPDERAACFIYLSVWCLVSVLWLFLVVPWFGLQCADRGISYSLTI